MKRLTAIILILILSCHCMVNMGIISYYQLNKDFIAETLCINRETPALKCHGKCFLNEQLAEAGSAEGDGAATQQQKTEIPSFLVSRYYFPFPEPFLPEQKYISIPVKLLLSIFSFAIFHPPRLGSFLQSC